MSGENEKLSRSKQRKLREGATLERERIKLITEVGAKYNRLELANKCIEDGTSLTDFKGTAHGESRGRCRLACLCRLLSVD